MLMPAPTYLFIDYENLQNIRLTDLNRENLHVLIFVGKNQHAIPFGLVTDAQLFGDRLEWIKIEREGRNNLDFHICFVMGQLDTKLDKNAAFVVLSRDKGFDAVVQYINGRGRPCSRLESVGPVLPPPTTAHGAILAHVTGSLDLPGETGRNFQPMNVNCGLFPPIGEPVLDEDGKRMRGKAKSAARKRALSRRALIDFETWIGQSQRLAA